MLELKENVHTMELTRLTWSTVLRVLDWFRLITYEIREGKGVPLSWL
jgi:hypothetical protein